MRVLITGATGLIGSHIVESCIEKGIEVHYLTTSKNKLENREDYKGFYWDPMQGVIDEAAIEGVDTIINLVGANIAERWTPSYKEKIVKSRTETAHLLYKTLDKFENDVKQIISASAIGVYPSSLQKLYTEEHKGVDDSFLGEVVVKWEESINNFEDLGLDVAKIRIGLVLAEEGGMLQKLKDPMNFSVGAPLGSGKQWQSWIHIEDVAGIFMHALEYNLTGVYNAVAPNPVTNKELVQKLAREMGKPLWIPKVPSVVLKAMLGEMSRIVLASQLVSSEKIETSGYRFKYTNVCKALGDLI
ncbi:TIGR01777 family oxidoreductase [Salegentibacter chungangensis]|uniref:TIGR01777 family oxidoreductase n=1 Tax=Salegentibacter chungangensis TaxID=1335724 RepID=A0ABW3NN67_9FLAO